ncbi:MAG: M67 family metallopeptidase [Desulfurococcales archaeon]|nr:M67 family metallopeptidase [Desulfurococcales archaeon]
MTWEPIHCGLLGRVMLEIASASREEATGVIIGVRGGDSVKCYALVMVENVEGSGTRFTMSPWDIVVAYTVAEKLGLEVVGLYHTHPCGAPYPSPRDRRYMPLWPLPWLIASPSGLAAWLYDKSTGSVRRLRLEEPTL